MIDIGFFRGHLHVVTSDLGLVFEYSQSKRNAPFPAIVKKFSLTLPNIFVGYRQEPDHVQQHALPIDKIDPIGREIRENVLDTKILMGQSSCNRRYLRCMRFDFFIEDLE